MAKKKSPLELPELPDTAPATGQEYAYQRLRYALMIGAIEPGRAITIRDLGDALELSATPVREALRRLSSEHALLILENRRIQVPPMTAPRFEELVALRCALETYAAKRAVPYVNKVMVDKLEALDGLVDKAISANDWQAAVLLNQRFHSGIYRANPDQVVLPMIDSIWLQLGPFLGIAVQYVPELYLVDRHHEIIEALRRREPLALGLAVEADIRDGVSHFGRELLGRLLGPQEDSLL